MQVREFIQQKEILIFDASFSNGFLRLLTEHGDNYRFASKVVENCFIKGNEGKVIGYDRDGTINFPHIFKGNLPDSKYITIRTINSRINSFENNCAFCCEGSTAPYKVQNKHLLMLNNRAPMGGNVPQEAFYTNIPITYCPFCGRKL